MLQHSLWIVLLVVSFAGALTSAASEFINEYQMKAAFLYNFAKFVEWPAGSFKTPDSPVQICIFGKNPFGSALSDAIQGKTLDGRTFVILQISEAPSKDSCQIVFVTAAGRNRFRALARVSPETGVLTVGETPGFSEDGGVINFRLENNKVRFEINVNAAEAEKLRLSSKLLSLASTAAK